MKHTIFPGPGRPLLGEERKTMLGVSVDPSQRDFLIAFARHHRISVSEAARVAIDMLRSKQPQ